MKSILKALYSFSNEITPVKKESDNPFFKSSYASLDSIQHHIKPALNNNGLVITQANIISDGLPYVQTTVFHVESGEFVNSVFPIVVSKNTAQEYGSAVSYAKRYSLSGLLNLIIEDEDDDGNSASAKAAEPVKPWLNETSEEFKKVKTAMAEGYTLNQVKTKYNVSKKVADLLNS